MAPRSARPMLHLQLFGDHNRDGEMPLTEVARVAERTQTVVSRLARRLVDHPSGRLSKSMSDATRLFLVGVRSGSTVLDIAGYESVSSNLIAEGMPGELSDMALSILIDSLETLSEPVPTLPINVDPPVIDSLDTWLGSFRQYERVSVDAELASGPRHAELEPREARKNLHHAELQPILPYISASHQALSGRLYALNLRTGTFSIEDDTGHAIRLSVPEDMREEAAQLVNTRVRALGTASLNERHRLQSFEVEALEPLPPVPLLDQEEFFQRRELQASEPLTGSLETGIIPDLSTEEIEAFFSVIEAE
jgi:hypothetical protein